MASYQQLLAIYIFCFFPPVEVYSSYQIGALIARGHYKHCKDVNLHTERLVCEIHSQEDEMKIERFGLSGCYGSTLSCAEDDIKTCMPLMTINALHYQCYCHSDEEGSVAAIDYSYYWTSWQELNKHLNDFRYKRGLVIDNGTDYMVGEFSRRLPDIFYIVANYSLPDTVFSASSEHTARYAVKRARIDAYFNWPCGWAANKAEPQHPWLKISLPNNDYVVMGVYIRRRCDAFEQYPSIVDVMAAPDDDIWEMVVSGEDISERYVTNDNTAFVNIWFSQQYITKHWKIIILNYVSHPGMKCDLLGYFIIP